MISETTWAYVAEGKEISVLVEKAYGVQGELAPESSDIYSQQKQSFHKQFTTLDVKGEK